MPEEKKSPWEIPSMLLHRYFDHHVGRDSAALTYYLLFMVFPLLVLFNRLVGLLAYDASWLFAELATIMPREVLELFAQYVAYASEGSSSALAVFSVVFSFYFPYRAAGELLAAVRKAYGLDLPQSVFRHQCKVLFFTVCLLLALLISLVLMVLGEQVLFFLAELLPLNLRLIEIYGTLRYVILSAVLLFTIWLLHRLAQDQALPLHRCLPGVLVSFGGWMLGSVLFSRYAENYANYSLIYGSIGAIIILLLWLYLSAMMLILGAEVNGVLLSRTQLLPRGKERKGGDAA